MLLHRLVVENPHYRHPDEYIAARLDRNGRWRALEDIERQVAVLAATRLTNVELAARMSLGRPALDRYLHRIYRTLGVDSRDALPRFVRERVAEP